MVIPQIISILIFFSGLLNIISALWTRVLPGRLMILEVLFSLQVSHFSRTLTLLFGIFLLFLANGLWQRKRRSWWLAALLLSLSSILHLVKGLDYEVSLVLLVPLTMLFTFRKLFVVQSGRIDTAQGLRTSLMILLMLSIYAFFGFFALQGQFSRPVSLTSISSDYVYSIFGIGKDTLIPHTKHAQWFEDSISLVGIVGITFVFGALFAPLLEKKKPTQEEKNRARNLVLGFGLNSSSYLSLMDDKQYFFLRNGNCLIAYKIRNNVVITLGDPIGSKTEVESSIKEFIKEVQERGLPVAFYNTGEEKQSVYKKLKMKLIKIGEEAVINISTFTTEKPEMKDIRYGINKMKRDQVSYQWYSLKQMPWNVVVDVELLYSQWLANRKGPSLTFSLNFHPFPVEENAFLLAIYSSTGNLWGAFSFLPYAIKKGMVLELMLRSRESPNGMVEAAIAEAIRYFKEQGIEKLSLGVAPLSDIELKKQKTLIEKGLQLIFDNFNQFYGYRSLFAFKQKFNPHWEHKYLAFIKYSQLPKVMLALLQVHIKEEGIIKSLFGRPSS